MGRPFLQARVIAGVESVTKSIALSTFDSIKGPVVHFFVTDNFVSEVQKEEISNMINFKASKDYFLVRVDQLTCYNIQFTIKSSISRGKIESLMLSLVMDKFPTRVAEKYFVKTADSFINFLRAEKCAELVFHLEKDYCAAEYQIVEQVYEQTLERLKEAVEKFV